MKRLRLSIVGFGFVGQGLAQLLLEKEALLRQKYDLDVSLVSVANSRHGCIYREEGLDIPLLLDIATRRAPLTEHPGVQHWHSALAGLQATSGEILVETTWTNLRDAEPALSHIRAALQQRRHVITANKGPVALYGKELFAMAQQYGVQLRAEATVMAGTPVLSTVREGMAGANVSAIRGILNGSTNYILSAMEGGRDYATVLAEARAEGYLEADPSADVEGHDAVAKALILAALVFGRSLLPNDVVRQGITEVTQEQVQQALAEGKHIKLLASLQLTGNGEDAPLMVRVELVALPEHDPLALVRGALNAITFTTDTLADVTIVGPGAGRLQTAQGLFADLLAIAAMY